MIRLIVGLGNPTKEYCKTRHNAGMWLIDELCRRDQVNLQLRSSFYGKITRCVLDGSFPLYLLAPTTFMNHSGRSVYAVMRYYKFSPEEVLVVHDELDFIPGVARFKQGGGSGGHNGLKDIILALKSNHFWRLRLGIGHPPTKQEVAHYVLSAPRAVEHDSICQAIQNSIMVLRDFCSGKAESAIRRLHE